MQNAYFTKRANKRTHEAELDELAEGLKALGHTSRLEIIRQLAIRDRCCGGDFCDCMPLAQSTISQHLDMLNKAGLVERNQEGTRAMFTLNRERLQQFSDELNAMCECADFSVKQCPPSKDKQS